MPLCKDINSATTRQQKFIRPFFQNYGTSWISDPEGYYYQFHLSEQSWNMGREYCLTLASDLVIIRSLQQLEWIIAHYPQNDFVKSGRTVQIGLMEIEKENNSGKEWRWVDNTVFNASYLEWEFTMIDVRMKNTTLDSRAQCALYDIDNRILKSIACGQTPEFDHINRFICQRSYVQYHEHEKRNNPLYEFFMHLFNKLHNTTKVGMKYLKAQPNAPKTEFLRDKTAEKPLRNNEVDTEETATPSDEKIEVRDERNNRNVQDDNQAVIELQNNQLDHQKSNVDERREKEKPMIDEKDDLNQNIISLNFSSNLPISDIQEPNNDPCDEIETEPEDQRTWYQQFVDIFQNLNLFLKHEKSSELRALLDNNNTNKTLVERLKELLIAKNNSETNKMKEQNETKIDDQYQQQKQSNERMQKNDTDGTTTNQTIHDTISTNETNNNAVNNDFMIKLLQVGDNSSLNKANIAQPRKEDSMKSVHNDGSVTSDQMKQKLEDMLSKHLAKEIALNRILTNERNESQSKIMPSDKMMNQNKFMRTQQETFKNSSFIDFKNYATKQTHDMLRTYITTVRPKSIKTTTRKTNKNQKFSFLTFDENMILEQLETGKNKTYLMDEISQAALDVEKILENAAEEIKHSFAQREKHKPFKYLIYPE